MIDKTLTRTLFLDRDGVINVERKNDYAKNVSEFVFIDGALEAISILSGIFDNIFIVTNQRGVGRGVMSQSDLNVVHKYMLDEIKANSGRITNIYVCTDICPTSINRKPNIGMAFIAQSEYPEVDFKHAVMVGNSQSDIEFGNKLGMYTVLVGDKYPENDKIYNNINVWFRNLHQFALSLCKT